MKIINDSNFSKRLLLSVAIGAVLGGAILFLVLLVLSFVMLKSGMSDIVVLILSTFALMLSAFASGLVSSKICGAKRLPVAVLTGLFFYIVVAIISAFATREGIGTLFLLRLILCIVSSAIGAIIGSTKKQKSII